MEDFVKKADVEEARKKFTRLYFSERESNEYRGLNNREFIEMQREFLTRIEKLLIQVIEDRDKRNVVKVKEDVKRKGGDYSRDVFERKDVISQFVKEWVDKEKVLNDKAREGLVKALEEKQADFYDVVKKIYLEDKESFKDLVLRQTQDFVKSGKSSSDALMKVYEILVQRGEVGKEVEKALVKVAKELGFSQKAVEQFKIKAKEDRQERETTTDREKFLDAIESKLTELRQGVEEKKSSILGAVAGMIDPRLGMVVEGVSDLMGGVSLPVGGRGRSRIGGIGASRVGGVFTSGTVTGSRLPIQSVGSGVVGMTGGVGGGGVVNAVKGVGKLVKGAPLLGAILGTGVGLLSGQGVAEAAGGAVGGVIGSAVGTVLGPIGTVVGGVVGGFVGEWLSKNFKDIKKETGKVLKDVWGSIKEFGSSVVEVLSEFQKFKEEIFGKMKDILSSVAGWVWSKIPQSVKDTAKEVYEKGKEVVKETGESIKEKGKVVVEKTQEISKKVYETGKKVIISAAESLGIIAREAEAASTDIYKGAGVISSGKGDAGGVSYGTYQLASQTGTLQRFLKESGYAKEFEGMEINSEEFKRKWKELAKTKEFAEAQHQFIVRTHYLPAVQALEKFGVNVGDNRALQEMAFARGVQQAGYFKNVLANAFKGMGKDEIKNLKDVDVVSRVYDELIKNVDVYFKKTIAKGGEKVRKGLVNRFVKEKEKLLKIAQLQKEGKLGSVEKKEEKSATEEKGVDARKVIEKSDIVKEAEREKKFETEGRVKEKPVAIRGEGDEIKIVPESMVEKSRVKEKPVAIRGEGDEIKIVPESMVDKSKSVEKSAGFGAERVEGRKEVVSKPDVATEIKGMGEGGGDSKSVVTPMVNNVSVGAKSTGFSGGKEYDIELKLISAMLFE